MLSYSTAAGSYANCRWGLVISGLLAGGLTALAQIPTSANVITWYLPLAKAAELLEERYAVPVTYEDPLWVWKPEIAVFPGSLDGRLLTVKTHSLALPKGLTPAESPKLDFSLVAKLVDAYHEQNQDKPRYRVLETTLGIHIVPAQAHNEAGMLVPVQSLLDTRVYVPTARRSAAEHVMALCEAVTAGTGVTLGFNNAWFDQYFAANGYLLPRAMTGQQRPYMLFEWGADTSTARDALIDLLAKSSSTMTWRLYCPPGTSTCILNILPLMVGPTRRVVANDRCTNCQPVPPK